MPRAVQHCSLQFDAFVRSPRASSFSPHWWTCKHGWGEVCPFQFAHLILGVCSLFTGEEKCVEKEQEKCCCPLSMRAQRALWCSSVHLRVQPRNNLWPNCVFLLRKESSGLRLAVLKCPTLEGEPTLLLYLWTEVQSDTYVHALRQERGRRLWSEGVHF